jgi:hypothetical protein
VERGPILDPVHFAGPDSHIFNHTLQCLHPTFLALFVVFLVITVVSYPNYYCFSAFWAVGAVKLETNKPTLKTIIHTSICNTFLGSLASSELQHRVHMHHTCMYSNAILKESNIASPIYE